MSLSSQVALMLCGKYDTAAKGRRPSLPRLCHEKQIVTETIEIATSNNKEKIICLAFGEFQGI